MAVKNHLHSSSGVGEIVSSTHIYRYRHIDINIYSTSIYIYMYMLPLQYKLLYGKWKFVFLGRQR
jgi:hypothetical protein